MGFKFNFKSISSIAKKVSKGVTGMLKNPVVASVASFVPGGSALVSTVSAVSATVDKALPEVAVQKKALAVVAPSVQIIKDIPDTFVPGVQGWKEKYIDDTRKVNNA